MAEQTTLDSLVVEAVAIRNSCVWPRSDHPADLVARLAEVSALVFRLEALERTAVLVMASARLASKTAQMDAEDAWATAATERTVQKGFGMADSAPRERYAGYSLATMPQQKAHRDADQHLDRTQACLEVVRLCHRGAREMKQDLTTAIRALPTITSLDR